MARDEKDIIPAWDGSSATWKDFETDVELYVDGAPTSDRCICGPRVARQLTGRARTAMRGMTRQDRDQLRAADGVYFLLDYLRRVIGGAPPAKTGQFLEQHVFHVERDQDKPVNGYVARENTAYNDFRRPAMRPFQQQEALPGSPAAVPPSVPEPPRAPAARPRPSHAFSDAEAAEEDEVGERTPQVDDGVASVGDRESGLYTDLPEPVKTWPFLRRAAPLNLPG